MEGFAEYKSLKQHATWQRNTVQYTVLVQNFQART